MHILLNGNVDKDDELLEACMPEDYNVQTAFNAAQATTRNNLADGTYTGSVVIVQDLIDHIQGLEDILFYRCTDNTCGGAITKHLQPQVYVPVEQDVCQALNVIDEVLDDDDGACIGAVGKVVASCCLRRVECRLHVVVLRHASF
ncbi:hypothetical protein VOLCADRAFT_90177 [Volvox carteri f. nagariensis]|uniref:Uncharacterized protein n=1 Tax=Volvox carteri f. nagariensis TaxID=3068 RepID=D8TTP4_VOLCA|nr:uncharacterized protein VOLCADRAFT_90177 [Volvox carteri f. nagariensis]EFJ49344.1 hypothetical protein VOLCADRAFT_90177 [Volvox carteri f. nagariensis]|eukprot:XP_002949792.1 hypothetical protein VOLCADRAFT_90177 [Volvox carteri f. nagariensis]